MAKRERNKHRADAASPADAPAASDLPARAGRRSLWPAAVVLGIILAAAAGFVVWHRPRDPLRVWVRRVAPLHEQKITRAMTRCFGGSDGPALRRLIPDVRGGRWPAPLVRCTENLMSETIASVMDFASDVSSAPGSVGRAALRERGRLEVLRTSLAQLQRMTGNLPRRVPVPDAKQAGIGAALESIALDLDAERRSFGDLTAAARDGASVW